MSGKVRSLFLGSLCSKRGFQKTILGVDHEGRIDLSELENAITNQTAIVSVGSGSITDVAKYARHLHAEKTGRKAH